METLHLLPLELKKSLNSNILKTKDDKLFSLSAKTISQKNGVIQNNKFSDADTKLSKKLLNEIQTLKKENSTLKQTILTLEQKNQELSKTNSQYLKYVSVIEKSNILLDETEDLASSISLFESITWSIEEEKMDQKICEPKIQEEENKDCMMEYGSKVSTCQSVSTININSKIQNLQTEFKLNISNYQQKIEELLKVNQELTSKYKYYKNQFLKSKNQLSMLVSKISNGKTPY